MFFFFFCPDTSPTEIYTLSLHDALPISVPLCRRLEETDLQRPFLDRHARARAAGHGGCQVGDRVKRGVGVVARSEEHTSELQSRRDLVCRLLLEKKKIKKREHIRM